MAAVALFAGGDNRELLIVFSKTKIGNFIIMCTIVLLHPWLPFSFSLEML